MIAMYSIDRNILHGMICAVISVILSLAVSVPASAEIMRVEVVGQAVATGAASDARLRSRALQDALYQAALKGGAQVNGYSVTSNSVLTSDVLVVRPDSQILDYSILESKVTGTSARVVIQAFVGSIDPSAVCARRATLDIAVHQPQVTIAASAPAWLTTSQNITLAMLERELDGIEGVDHFQAPVLAAQRRSTIAAEFDYSALTLGVLAPRKPRAHGQVLTTQISLSALQRSSLKKVLVVQIESKLLDPTLKGPPIVRVATRELLLRRATPINVINANSLAPREDIFAQIGAIAAGVARSMVVERMCRSLSGKLVLSEGKLSTHFGSQDGLTRHHLAYTQGTDTPYEILEIEVLEKNYVQLRPLDSSRKNTFFAGQTIQFMELK